jgi:hypothetical protein
MNLYVKKIGFSLYFKRKRNDKNFVIYLNFKNLHDLYVLKKKYDSLFLKENK